MVSRPQERNPFQGQMSPIKDKDKLLIFLCHWFVGLPSPTSLGQQGLRHMYGGQRTTCEIQFLPSTHRCWGLSLGHQAWWQASLPTELYCQPLFCFETKSCWLAWNSPCSAVTSNSRQFSCLILWSAEIIGVSHGT